MHIFHCSIYLLNNGIEILWIIIYIIVYAVYLLFYRYKSR